MTIHAVVMLQDRVRSRSETTFRTELFRPILAVSSTSSPTIPFSQVLLGHQCNLKACRSLDMAKPHAHAGNDLQMRGNVFRDFSSKRVV
jgi:hypothetical protein